MREVAAEAKHMQETFLLPLARCQNFGNPWPCQVILKSWPCQPMFSSPSFSGSQMSSSSCSCSSWSSSASLSSQPPASSWSISAAFLFCPFAFPFACAFPLDFGFGLGFGVAFEFCGLAEWNGFSFRVNQFTFEMIFTASSPCSLPQKQESPCSFHRRLVDVLAFVLETPILGYKTPPQSIQSMGAHPDSIGFGIPPDRTSL